MRPTIYLDVDGVLANFVDAYDALPGENNMEKFHRAVTENKIFRNLEKMRHADTLHRAVRRAAGEFDFDVIYLTSVGTEDKDIGLEATYQKYEWLQENGFWYPSRFIRGSWEERKSVAEIKATFANKHSLLIDDSVINCLTFQQSGVAITYFPGEEDRQPGMYKNLIFNTAREIKERFDAYVCFPELD